MKTLWSDGNVLYLQRFLFIWMHVCVLSWSVLSDSVIAWTEGPRLLCPWDFPGKNTGVGYNFLLQGIFLTQGLNPSLPCLLHWQADSLPLSHLGSPTWVYTFVKACKLYPLKSVFFSVCEFYLNHKIHFGREAQERVYIYIYIYIYIYLWLIRVVLWPKPAQYCTASITN